MLHRVALRSLRVPAFRATPATFRPQIRTYAKVGKPSSPSMNDEPIKPTNTKANDVPVNKNAAKADEKPNASPAPSDPEFTSTQPEFDTKAAASENAPQNETANAEELKPEQTFKIPDMRGGLPSTLEHELSGGSAEQSAKSALNLTEDPTKETEGGENGPKRPRGELPASAYVSSSEKKRAKAANYMYGAALAAFIGGFAYLGRTFEDEEEERKHPEIPAGWSPTAMWARFRARTGDQLEYYSEPAFKKLLPDVDPSFERPYTLCLSLEDLLIHSEWSREHGWRMAKRPGVDYFLRYLSQYYELVIFTTVPWAMGETVIKKLDPYHIITWPLFREATMYRNGEYVKASIIRPLHFIAAS